MYFSRTCDVLKKKVLLRVEGRALLGFQIDTLNTRGCVRFFSFWKNTEERRLSFLSRALSPQTKESRRLVVNTIINKKRFIFTLLRYNAFYRVCSHHSLSTALFFFLSGESYRKRSGKITR